MPVKVSKAMRNNELRGPTAIDTDIIPSDSEHVFAQEALYQEAMMRYHCAILEMRTKLEVLSKDMTVRYRRNPIEFIESRLKKPSSIARKLKKMGLEVTVDNMTQHLSDIAGIRVLCAYIDDIYEIARMLARQKDVRIITVKDYIKVPKDNGYRSYHLIVEIPVYFSDKVRPVRCEIQIRTIAMDFWATLDHDMQYKKQVDNSARRAYNGFAAGGLCLKSGKAPAIMGGDAQKEAAGMDELQLGDLVQMRKTHPCGSDKWTVIRVGADIKIRCSGCGRIVMMDRADFTKRMKKVIEHAKEPIRGTNETD